MKGYRSVTKMFFGIQSFNQFCVHATREMLECTGNNVKCRNCCYTGEWTQGARTQLLQCVTDAICVTGTILYKEKGSNSVVWSKHWYSIHNVCGKPGQPCWRIMPAQYGNKHTETQVAPSWLSVSGKKFISSNIQKHIYSANVACTLQHGKSHMSHLSTGRQNQTHLAHI